MFSLGAVVVTGAVSSACSDSPSSPTAPALRVEVVSGADQKGLAGRILPAPIVVRVVDAGGTPLRDVRVGFEVLDGGGTPRPAHDLTDAQGRVATEWTLGGPQVRVQRLRAYLLEEDASDATSGDDSPASVTIHATAVTPDQSDVVILRNALGSTRGVLVVRDDELGRLNLIQEHAATDTIVPLHPLDEGEFDVVVFPGVNPLRRVTFAWTEGVDTAVVELRPPFRLPVRFEVYEGPFDERVAVTEEHIARTQQIWDEEGMGIMFGEVEILDRTVPGSEVNIESSTICAEATERPLIRIRYIHQIDGGHYLGWGCGNVVYMAAGSEEYPTLLAHELGHVFWLLHMPSGVMRDPPGRTFTDGEVFRAHFHERSALTWLFGLHPPETHRYCQAFIDPSPCLPVDYELPG